VPIPIVSLSAIVIDLAESFETTLKEKPGEPFELMMSVAHTKQP